MFEKYRDYMYYLLTSPFKRVRKEVNQWYILFKVLGKYFDDAMNSLYDARKQTMVATCEPIMLPVHADDRHIQQYPVEDDENFRVRIANYQEVLKLGGSDAGIMLAVRTLGFDNINIVKAKDLKNDDKRWAEFYIIINLNPDAALPIDYNILKSNVRKIKQVGALDNYLFLNNVNVQTKSESNECCIVHIKNEIQSEQQVIPVIKACIETQTDSEEHLHTSSTAWYFDGTFKFDGNKHFVYQKEEEL